MIRPATLAVALVCYAVACNAVSAADSGEAQQPRALAEFIPADVGLCVEMHDLRAHLGRFTGGALWQRLREHPEFAKAAEKVAPELRNVTRMISGKLGMPVPELTDSVLGRDVLLAIWPTQTDGPPPAALLVRAPEPDRLRKLVNHVVAAQQKAGSWQASRVMQEGAVSCTVHIGRVEAGGTTAWLAVLPDERHGDVGVVATSEAVFRHVFHAFATSAEGSLSATAPYREATSRAEPDPLLRVFLNPRPWDEVLAAQPAPAGAERTQARRALLDLWQASQFALVTVTLGSRASAEVHWQVDRDKLPLPMNPILARLEGPLKLAELAPADTVALLAGRVDLGGWLQQALRDPDLTARAPWLRGGDDPLSWGLILTVASGLGPEFGALLLPHNSDANTANTSAAAKGLPFDVVVTAQTQALSAEDAADGPREPALAESLDPLVRQWLAMTARAHSARKGQPTIQVETHPADAGRVTTVTGLPGLAGRSLSYTVRDARVWFGTAESQLRGGLPVASQAEALAAQPAWQRLQNPRCAPASHVAYVNVAALRKLLTSSPATHEAFMTLASNDKKVETERNWQALLAVTKLVDAVLLEARNDTTGLAVSLRAE